MSTEKGYTLIEFIALLIIMATIGLAVAVIYAIVHFLMKFW